MRQIVRYMLSIVSASVAGWNGGACAEIPDLNPVRMREVASHIFTGKVARIYSTVDRTAPPWETTHSVAEVQLTRVEKGKHEGRLAYVRFWNKRYAEAGTAPPGAYGHRGVPKAGGTTRVFVVLGEDGGFDVLPPNGFEPLPEAEGKK